MKVLVTGVAGQLGYEVANELVSRGHCCIGSDLAPSLSLKSGNEALYSYHALDITDRDSAVRFLREEHPDAVIHCAAWTAVDAAEDHVDEVMKINVEGTENLALGCKEVNAKMMYLSTDYVFDGTGDEPWDPNNQCYGPLNVYGQSKLDGELKLLSILSHYFIVRTSWIFGLHGSNFVNEMIKLGKKKSTISVVSDQIGTPTYTVDLARLLADMIETDQYGIYHATNEGGYISWAQFAGKIFEYMNMQTEVKPIPSDEYVLAKAKRPLNSRLSKQKLTQSGFAVLPHWEDALKRYLEQRG